MLQAYRAKKFLENCRILEQNEEVFKGGKGVAVIFNEELQRFDFCEYNNTEKVYDLTWIGTIHVQKLLYKSKNPNKVILLFEKEAKLIVNKRPYKMDSTSFEMLKKFSANKARG